MEGFNQPIFVTKSFLPPLEEYTEELKQIWNSNHMTNSGPLHNSLEDSLKDYLKVNNSVLYCNGHLALEIAINSLKLKGEVITTAFTFISTTNAIVRNNLIPIFCDINMEDYTIDTSKIEELITDNTVAIIPVHVYGNVCNIDEIERLAQKYNLKVIYDAAHVFGVEVNGKGIGSFGDVSMFSLHATKVFNSIEGGLLTFNNSEFIKPLSIVKNFGITGYETAEVIGINAKMNEFQAAMGLVNLRYIDEQIEKRRSVTDTYRQELKNVKGIRYIEDRKNIKHNYAYFPILIDESKTNITRDELHERLKEYNIYTRKYFYPLVTEYECYKDKYNTSNLVNAKYVSDRILTLPIYGELALDDVRKICNIVKYIIGSKL